MTTKHRGWRWVVLVGVFALVAAACSSADDNTASEDADASAEETSATTQAADTTEATEPTDEEPTEPAEPSGSTEAFTYTAAIFADLTTDNYWAYTDPESSVWNAYVFSDHAGALFNQQPPANTLVPSLAEGLPAEPVENGDVWTITQPMRQGVVWSDGEAIDANDVVFTAKAAIDLQLGGNWLTNYPTGAADDPATEEDEFRLGIVDVRAVDDYTVEFDWNGKPGLSFWQFGAAIAPVLPEHFWADAVHVGASARGSVCGFRRWCAVRARFQVRQHRTGGLRPQRRQRELFVRRRDAHVLRRRQLPLHVGGAWR